jgi:predicted hydrocarbon binding protein
MMIRRRDDKPTPNVESAIIIGYSVGLKSILGVGSQAMSNIAGKYVGKELCLYFKSKDQIRDLSDVERILSIFADLKLKEDEGTIIAEISNCKICPKRIGGYEFEGTACPWGGILTGLLEECFGKRFSMNISLKPGKVCFVELK